MGTYTSQILVGRRHQNHGGLQPESNAQIFLSENDRPCWVMDSNARGSHVRKRQTGQFRWIPESPNTILEDGLLFVALHVMRHEDLFAQAPRELTSQNTPLVNLGDVSGNGLTRLRAACRNYDFGGQGGTVLILSAFEGSTVLSQLSVIDEYHFDCEVLTPRFSRTFSSWTGDTTVTGSLS